MWFARPVDGDNAYVGIDYPDEWYAALRYCSIRMFKRPGLS